MACDLGDDCEHVITALLARGANMHKQCDDEGVPIGSGSRMTALHRAAQADWPKVLALLRGAGGDINVGVAPTVLEVALRYESHASVEEILSTSWATGPACLSGPALASYADNRVGWSTLLLLAFEESDDSELRQRRQRDLDGTLPGLEARRAAVAHRRADHPRRVRGDAARRRGRPERPCPLAARCCRGAVLGRPRRRRQLPDADRCITPLMVACVWNNVPLVRTLLAYGADPELRTRGGSRALEFTLVHGSLNALAALRDHYAAMPAGTLTGALVLYERRPARWMRSQTQRGQGGGGSSASASVGERWDDHRKSSSILSRAWGRGERGERRSDESDVGADSCPWARARRRSTIFARSVGA